MSALDERHRREQELLARRLELALARLVDGTLFELSQDEVVAYHDGAYPLMAGGQQRAATLAAGYGLTKTRARGAPRVAVDVAGALRVSGVGVTPESRSLVAPPLRARALVAEGTSLVEAKAAASSYAFELGSRDLQAAQRVGIEQGVAAGGQRIIGYRKEPSGGACEWCKTVASGELYSSADSVPFHERDHCAVAPVLADED